MADDLNILRLYTFLVIIWLIISFDFRSSEVRQNKIASEVFCWFTEALKTHQVFSFYYNDIEDLLYWL